MGKNNKKSLQLGIFVIVGLALFIWAIYFLGSQKKLFNRSITVKSQFTNVVGLVEGNKVRYSGITVGAVSEISIISDSSILVEMTVDRKISKFIRKDSKVEISSDGLMGSKIVNILPGTAAAGSVSDNEFLATINPLDLQDVLNEAKRAVDDGRIVMQNLIEITNKINSGEGDLALLINENTITEQVNAIGAQIEEATGKVNRITAKIDNGEGDLGRMINDTFITTEVVQLLAKFNSLGIQADSISYELLDFSKELNSGNGIITRLVYDNNMADQLDTAIEKADAGIEEVMKAAETIENSWIFNLFSKGK